MRHWILFAAFFVLAALGRAQEQTATVLLEDGRELTGRVVAKDLTHLQIAVDNKILKIAAKYIKSCKFDPPLEATEAEGEAGGSGAEAEVAPAPAGETAAPAATAAPAEPGAGAPESAAAAEPDARAAEPAAAADDGEATETAPARPAATRRPASAHTAATPPEAEIAVLGPRSRLESRLAGIGQLWPWLRTDSKAQQLSILLLLFAGLSLIVHWSAGIAGAEARQFGCSMGIACGYLIAAGVQLALVPANDFAGFSVLIGNTAMILFTLRKAFALHRINALVAFTVQIGFAVLAVGVLQLVTMLLGSVAT